MRFLVGHALSRELSPRKQKDEALFLVGDRCRESPPGALVARREGVSNGLDEPTVLASEQ